MAKLPKPNEVYIAFEYAAPVGGRVDCMFFGKGNNGKKNVIIIELKQWGNQVEVYSAYDNPPIGIVLGAKKDEILMEYALQGIDNQLFAAHYQLYLPNREELQAQLNLLLDAHQE